MGREVKRDSRGKEARVGRGLLMNPPSRSVIVCIRFTVKFGHEIQMDRLGGSAVAITGAT